jgi:hypothetical protein
MTAGWSKFEGIPQGLSPIIFVLHGGGFHCPGDRVLHEYPDTIYLDLVVHGVRCKV